MSRAWILLALGSGLLFAGGACSGSPAASGAAGMGGGAGSGAAGTAGAGSGACTFAISATTSAVIATVGIVIWSTDLPSVTSAHIDFGLTTSYGMTAPVDLTATGYRTLLLGMKASKSYHFRVVASNGGEPCASDDQTIATGPAPNGLAKITVATPNPAALYGGFLITGQYLRSVGAGSPAYILDADGDYVWWFNIDSDVTGARMSYDGSHMWINGANVPKHGAHVHRVTMDGLTDENLSEGVVPDFTGQSHQLTVLPDETVAFYAYGANGCDDIKERAPDGTVRTIVNAQVAHGGTTACHVNAIEYSPEDDTLVFSDLDYNDVTKIKRDGSTVWVLNGAGATFTGDSWLGSQHGLHILGLDRLLLFNNDNHSGCGSGSSAALEMKLDLGAGTVTKVWYYVASPPLANLVMGDVQRLPNGNTIVGFSTLGVLHEVDGNAQLVQTLTWPLGATFGYLQKRATLYGPPPR
jgi:hypothetical protein